MIHGEIKINDVVFGKWSAERMRRIASTAGNHLYEYHCTYEMRGLDGYMRVAEFNIVHDAFSGGGHLAALLIAEGERRARHKEAIERIGGTE